MPLIFPRLLLLLAPCGAYWGWKNPSLRWFVLFAGSIFVIDFVFAFRYLVADAYKFFTPDYVIFALFIGIAVPHLGKPSAAKGAVLCLLALLPIGVYEVAPSILQRSGVSLGVSRAIPLRNNYEYFIRPRKNGDDGAERFAQVALGQAAPEGLLITDGDTNIKNVLTYVRDAEGVEPKVVLTVGPGYQWIAAHDGDHARIDSSVCPARPGLRVQRQSQLRVELDSEEVRSGAGGRAERRGLSA